MQQLNEDVIDTAADIVNITETWFKPQHNEDLFSLPGFARIRKDRCKRKEGGVCVFVKESYQILKISASHVMEYTEDLWTDIISADGSHIIVCLAITRPSLNTTRGI